MTWSILLDDETLPVPSAEVGKLLQQVLGGVTYDHIRRLNTEFGWVARGLPEDQADELLGLIRQAGYAAAKKDDRDLVGDLNLIRVRKLVLDEDALRVEVGHLGELQDLPWSGLTMVSLGTVRNVQQKLVKQTKRKVGLNKGMLAMGIPVPKMTTVTKTSYKQVADENLLLHLVFAAEGLIREVRPSAFDYSYLGERLCPTGGQNLVLLMDDLRSLAPEALWTAPARDFQESHTAPHAFRNEREFLRYTHWILEKTFDAPPA